MTDEEWATVLRPLRPPSPERSEEQARKIVGTPISNTRGLELMRGFDVLDQLDRIDCPTLVCVGELDPVTPVAASREIFEALPAGIARLEVIEGAGHFTWKDVPDRYWPVVVDFVRGRHRSMTFVWFVIWFSSDRIGDRESLLFDPVNWWAATLILAFALDVGRASGLPGKSGD